MHLTVDFDVFHDINSVGLQAAVEVVQVFNAAHFSGGGVEEFGGDSLRKRVVTFLLVTRDQVISFFRNHPVKFRNLVWRILQVCIHSDDNIALCHAETTIKGRGFSVVSAEFDGVDARIVCRQIFDDVP